MNQATHHSFCFRADVGTEVISCSSSQSLHIIEVSTLNIVKEYPLPDYGPYRRVAWIREHIAIGTAYAAVHMVDARSLAVKATVSLHKVDIDVVNSRQFQWMWHISDLKYIPIRSQLIVLMSLGHVLLSQCSPLYSVYATWNLSRTIPRKKVSFC